MGCEHRSRSLEGGGKNAEVRKGVFGSCRLCEAVMVDSGLDVAGWVRPIIPCQPGRIAARAAAGEMGRC